MKITKRQLIKLIKESYGSNAFNNFQYGKFNLHNNELRGQDTFEFNVKNFHDVWEVVEILSDFYDKYKLPKFMSNYKNDEESIEPEFSYFLADFSNYLGDIMFKSFKSKYISDWSFLGRNNGWYVIILSSYFKDLTENQQVKILSNIEDKFMKIKKLFNDKYEIYFKKFLQSYKNSF